MSRLKRAEATLRAADHWKERCLLGQGSVFWDDKKLWTFDNFQALSEGIPQNEQSMNSRKLQAWLADASADAKRLATEVTWFGYLSEPYIRYSFKDRTLRDMWDWLGVDEPYPEDSDLLAKVTLKGVVKTNMAPHRAYEYSFLCERMMTWYGLDFDERRRLIADPWQFGEWIRGARDAKSRQFPHVLCYLLFPDQYEPFTRVDKRKIIDGFLGTRSIPIDNSLLDVRKRLEQKDPDGEVDFLKIPWRPGAPRKATSSHPREEPDVNYDAWYRERFGSSRVWLMAPGRDGTRWPSFVENHVASLGWGFVGDLRGFGDADELLNAISAGSDASTQPTNTRGALWNFMERMKEDDVIVARRGKTEILGAGTVSGDYVYDESAEDHRHKRKVEWRRCDPAVSIPPALAGIPSKTLTDFSGRKQWLHDMFELVDPALRPCDSEGTAYTIEDGLEDLFIDDDRFIRILEALRRKKNLILQGPPGTGKTFMARRLAWCLVGRKDSSPIEMVQFHQSYAYEDFVQGYRPTETGGFTLRNGVFYEFCQRAKTDGDTPHVFVIDEINRGNMSRIFGELLMLIEADKRGKEYAAALTYSKHGERFFVPPNVYVLGMMNTADRSLAVVDYALRRRFAFEDLKPAFGSPKFVEHLVANEVDEAVAERIRDRMNGLNEKVREDPELGSGFEIGHSYFVPTGPQDAADTWYEEVVKTQIAPLLREYWFEDGEKAKSAVKDLLA